MVNGLNLFRDHFKDYSYAYILIGGTASSIAMDITGEEFRVTKDLDIVLCVEALDLEFIKKFWDFIHAGEYKNCQKSSGKKLFYRFYDPENNEYPLMLELFSRIPDSLDYKGSGYLTPIPAGEEVSSLSAILLNESYYGFIKKGKRMINNLSVIAPEYIILLKAKAYLDLTERRRNGEQIDTKNIKKHRNDIFRLFRILSPSAAPVLPLSIRDDFKYFILKRNERSGTILMDPFPSECRESTPPLGAEWATTWPGSRACPGVLRPFIDLISSETIDLKPFGYKDENLKEIVADLKEFYKIDVI